MKSWQSLPHPIELMIYEFLTSEEFLFIIPRICQNSLRLARSTSVVHRKGLSNEFAQYFAPGQVESYNDQDITQILAIMVMYHRFSSGIHLHNTPYYLNLIEQTLAAFFTIKNQSIKFFPWAAVIMGNLMRVKKKEAAVIYFRMAIQADPSLSIAKTLLTLNCSNAELKELQNTQPLPPALIFDDFILSHLKRIEKGTYRERVGNDLYPLESKAHFQFLENNFFYVDIISKWEAFVKAMTECKSQSQYLRSLQSQMNETKDSVLASHMAAGLVQVYSKRNLVPELTKPELDKRINACIQKGGFDFCLREYYEFYREPCKFSNTLFRAIKPETPLRPGLLAFCYLRLADLAQGLEPEGLRPEWVYPQTKIAFCYFWQGIVAGLPEAVFRFNHFINSKVPTPDALISQWQVDLTKDPMDEFYDGRGLLFKIFFAAQQSITWLLGLYSNEALIYVQDNAKKNLIQYTELDNSYVSASASMALGLRCAQEQDQKTAEQYFRKARNRYVASVDYLDFAREQGYRLPPSVAESKSFRLISEWAKSAKSPYESIGATSLMEMQ